MEDKLIRHIYDKKPWTAEDVRSILDYAQLLNVDSLDRIITSDDDEDFVIGNLVQDDGPTPHDLVVAEERTKTLKEYIDKLPPRMQAVIRYRYGMYDGLFHTLDETGLKYGVTRERIRQIERKALSLLKKKLEKHKIYKSEDL